MKNFKMPPLALVIHLSLWTIFIGCSVDESSVAAPNSKQVTLINPDTADKTKAILQLKKGREYSADINRKVKNEAVKVVNHYMN